MLLSRLCLPLSLLMFALMLVSGCLPEEPGQPKTSGASQFVGEGFAFKYPDNAGLDIKRNDEWAQRRIEVTGPEVETGGISYTSFAFALEVFGAQTAGSAREFAEARITEAYEAAVEAGEPTGMWPVDPETGLIEGRMVRAHGLEGWEVRFFAGDAELVRRFVIGPETNIAVAMTYRDMPPENNPFAALHYSMYVMALESLRVD